MSVLFYILAAANALVALFFPWVGLLASYLVILLTPQNVWWWAFEGIQPVRLFVVPTLLGLGIYLFSGRLRFDGVKTKTALAMIFLLICASSAYFFGPYVDVVNASRFYEPSAMYEVVLKAYIMFFVAALLIDSPRKLAWAFLPLVITSLYMGYWANAQYFIEGKFGRIGGPVSMYGASVYADENIFSTLFVIGFPLFLCFSSAAQNLAIKVGALVAVPMLWHAAFLTASRGALLGIFVVLIGFTILRRRLAWGGVMLCLFAIAFAWQGGETLQERSSTIVNYEDEGSATSRLAAWEVAMSMMASHPITGVGFASFGQAFPSFASTKPIIAHNTFFQIGAEWGILAGVCYLFLIFGLLYSLWKGARQFQEISNAEMRWWKFAYESLFLALLGFFACSMFLSLEKFELFHYLVFMSNATIVLGAKRLGELVAEDRSKATDFI